MTTIASAAEGKRGITDLTAIPLQIGVNKVERFTPDGRQAIIAVGWRDNGNAHGYNLFLVLMPTAIGKTDWNVVDIVDENDSWKSKDIIRDYPHADEDYISSVRFARGKIKGAAATLLITATRQIGTKPYPEPAIVTFKVYKLERNSDIGTTRDFFKPVLTWNSVKQYRNSDLALYEELRLPLPKSYAGPSINK